MSRVAADKIKKFTFLLVAVEIFYFSYAVYVFLKQGVFPAPIFYDPSDSFMDLYHTVFWSWHEGRFDDWHSIYPVFVFFLGRVISDPICASTVRDAFAFRSCDTSSIFVLASFYFCGCLISSVSIVRDLSLELSKRTWALYIICWFWITVLSVSGLFALERGNTIIFVFFLLSLISYFKLNWFSAVCMGAAISIKPYVLTLLFVPFAKKKIGYVILSLMTAVILNVFADSIVQDDKWYLVIDNIMGFAGSSGYPVFEKLWFPTSLDAYIKVLRYPNIKNALGFDLSDLLLYLSTLILWILRGFYLIGLLYLLRDSEIFDENVSIFYILVGLLVSIDSIGGYGILLLFPFLGSVLKANVSKLKLIILFAIFAPFEVSSFQRSICNTYSYFSGALCIGEVYISFWSYVRTICMAAILSCMTFYIAKRGKF